MQVQPFTQNSYNQAWTAQAETPDEQAPAQAEADEVTISDGEEPAPPASAGNMGWGAAGAVAGAIPIVGGVSNLAALTQVAHKINDIENPLLRVGAYVGSVAIAGSSVIAMSMPEPICYGILAANAALGGYAWYKAGA